MDLHLRGKRVWITGASQGIGAAAAEAFAEEGCDLQLAARSGDQLKALADRLRSAHQIDASAHVTDLRKPEDIARLVKDASDVDILVNNAGDIPGGSIDKIDEATWRHAWELKVFGYINITRAIYAQMKARGGGVIVNDIGAAGEKFDANYVCGSAGNAALMAFTRALGGKSLADNIRVVGINPGPVVTDRHVTLLKTRARHAVGERRRNARHQPHRAQIDVLVELAPDFYERAPQGNVIGDLGRPADRTEIDRVVLADLRLPVLRHHLAVLFVIVPGSEVEMVEMHGNAVLFRGRFQHAQAFRDHFLADAVTGNDRDPILLFGAAHREFPCLHWAGLMPVI